ncbi:unnamed protein product [Rotaria sordida]|uniref:F-box domain-containing protein n=1 Tax=Rotaria sordida TaxID=392033 RepID=A0A814QSN1_9BILA|nr:unnamed protein product [Rotaria sordida]CAF3939376.1 unnamed protein product [Rotaria sordida]
MNNKFTLEQLPNEIFQELFEYFDIYELYRTFSQLNFRVDSLLSNFKYLQVIFYTPEDIDYRVNRYFLPKTKTLIINHTKNFYDPLKINLISHIHCLILCQPTREQWNSIQPLYFPYLERLYLINSRFIYRTEQLCYLIFSNKFPYLYSCSLPHISYEINNQWTYSLKLQSLQINIWDIRVYIQILNACPKLIYLKIELNGGNNQEKIQILNTNKNHSILRHLTLYLFCPITYDFIDSILSFVPNLEYFILDVKYPRPSYISVNTLASILEYRTPRLNRININIILPKSLCCKEQMDTKYLLFRSCKIQYELNQFTRLIVVGSLGR